MNLGTVIAYWGSPNADGTVTSPEGTWLLCDGRTVNRTDCRALYNIINDTYGQGDNETTFNIPNLQCRFLRGLDPSGTVDPDVHTRTAMNTGGNAGAAIGSCQGAQTGPHLHKLSGFFSVQGAGCDNHDVVDNNPASGEGNCMTDVSGGPNVQPKCALVNFIILAQPPSR